VGDAARTRKSGVFGVQVVEKAQECDLDGIVGRVACLAAAGEFGDGSVAAVDGSQIETWENNILAETSIRYGTGVRTGSRSPSLAA
jgi:Tn3 transposase DDE domain